MAESAPGGLEGSVQRMLELLDAMDFRGLTAMTTDDAQGVDELSRRWIRGRAGIEAYFRQLEGTVDDVRSQVRDLQTTEWGDVGLATFVLEQTYTMSGRREQLSAPTTIVFRRRGGDWAVALIHSVPLPDDM